VRRVYGLDAAVPASSSSSSSPPPLTFTAPADKSPLPLMVTTPMLSPPRLPNTTVTGKTSPSPATQPTSGMMALLGPRFAWLRSPQPLPAPAAAVAKPAPPGAMTKVMRFLQANPQVVSRAVELTPRVIGAVGSAARGAYSAGAALSGSLSGALSSTAAAPAPREAPARLRVPVRTASPQWELEPISHGWTDFGDGRPWWVAAMDRGEAAPGHMRRPEVW